jgi:hypothetical protein
MPSGSHDRILISVWHLLFYRCRAPPLTRGRVCHLYCSPELLQFNNFAAGLFQLLYFGMPLVCLLHIEEAQALPPRQGSNPWGGTFVTAGAKCLQPRCLAIDGCCDYAIIVLSKSVTIRFRVIPVYFHPEGSLHLIRIWYKTLLKVRRINSRLECFKFGGLSRRWQ